MQSAMRLPAEVLWSVSDWLLEDLTGEMFLEEVKQEGGCGQDQKVLSAEATSRWEASNQKHNKRGKEKIRQRRRSLLEEDSDCGTPSVVKEEIEAAAVVDHS